MKGQSAGADDLDGTSRPDDYRALLERVPAIVYIADPGDGPFHYVSPHVEAILGFSVQEWLADGSIWARQLHPDDREAVIANEAASATADLDGGHAVEYRMFHRDGHVVWIRDEARLIKDALGRPALARRAVRHHRAEASGG